MKERILLTAYKVSRVAIIMEFQTGRVSSYRKDRKYRSEMNIISDILMSFNKSTSGTVGKTRIMYAANLNTKMLSEYLEKLIKYGLIIDEDVGNRTVYRITPKGILTLMILLKLRSLLDSRGVSESRVGLLETIKDYFAKNVDGKIMESYTALGESGLIHYFDLMIGLGGNKYIAVYISSTSNNIPSLEYLWFVLGLLDVGVATGIFVELGNTARLEKKLYDRIEVYKLSLPRTDQTMVKSFLTQITE